MSSLIEIFWMSVLWGQLIFLNCFLRDDTWCISVTWYVEWLKLLRSSNWGLRCSQRRVRIWIFCKSVLLRKRATCKTFSEIISTETLNFTHNYRCIANFKLVKVRISILQHLVCLLTALLIECAPGLGGSMHKTGILLKTWFLKC